MKVVNRLIIVGLSAAAGAIYFLDGRKGDKRRRRVRKELEQAAHSANGMVRDYSRQAKALASNIMKNGAAEWIPSPRVAGALGSTLAVYSAGRRGPAGAILRIVSLGLFARALMTSNKGSSSIEERPETRGVPPSYRESLVRS